MTEATGEPVPLDAAASPHLLSAIESSRRHAMSAVALALAFFAPWGEASGTVYGFGLSKIFVVAAFLFVFLWAVGGRPRFGGLSRWLSVLMLFLVCHTLVCYLVIEKGDLGFGYVGEKEYAGGGIGMVEARGVSLIRFFLFAAMAYALVKHLDSARRLRTFCLAYGLGLCAMLLFATRHQVVEDAGGERFSGGFFNANAFAMTCWTALFFALFVARWLRREEAAGERVWGRVCVLAIILASSHSMLSSGSRSGLLGCLIGLTALTAFSPLRRGLALWVPIGFLALSISLVAAAPETVLTSLAERITVQRVRESGGGRRLEIWRAYADRLDEYWLYGVGLDNCADVVVRDFYIRRPTHNLFLKILVEFGIVGLVLLVLALWRQFRLAWDAKQWPAERAVILGLAVCWFANILFHDFFFARDTWIILACVSAFARFSTVSEQ